MNEKLNPMADILELSKAIDHEKIERARVTPPENKFWAGARLFDHFETWAKAGIRFQFPTADDEEVRRIFRERLAILRRGERRG